MTVNRLNNRFSVRNDVLDSITPSPVVQRDITAPSGEWKPAPWLPIVFKKQDAMSGADAFVISSGKVVAMSNDGFVVPAGLREALAKAPATTVLTYTADDYEWGVVDLVTGQRYATNGTTAYTANQVAEALIERGLVEGSSVVTGYGTYDPSTDDFTESQIAEIIEDYISAAVGVTTYDVHVWSGRPEDGDQWFTNYSKQHLIQFQTEVQMKVPHRVASSTSSDSFDVSVIDAGALKVTAAAGVGDFPAAGEVWTAAALASLSRYAIASSDNVVAFALANWHVAKNTTRTPISVDVSGVLTKEKASIALISSEGDWYLDGDVGLLFLHSDTYATLVGNNTDPTFTYNFYDDAGIGATSDRYIYFDGEGKPGDFVSYDEHSNFVRMGQSADVLGASNTRAIGRLLAIDTEPKDLLEHVKTAFELNGINSSGKMPGTATEGYSDLITLATEDVADRIAIINVRI